VLDVADGDGGLDEWVLILGRCLLDLLDNGAGRGVVGRKAEAEVASTLAADTWPEMSAGSYPCAWTPDAMWDMRGWRKEHRDGS